VLFSSWQFLFVFLPVCLAGHWCLGARSWRTAAKLWLLACSLVFYGWFEWRYLLLIIGSVLVNYAAGLCIDRFLAGGPRRAAKIALSVGIALDLAALGYFKYADFLLGTVATTFGFDAAVFNVVLPLAISFFTFQQIAYLVDVYQRRTLPHGLLDYALFVCFFPQLIAGPIVHHSEMVPQFEKERVFVPDLRLIDLGGCMLLLGLFKKVVFADGLGPLVDETFAAAETGAAVTFFEAWLGTLAFALQIYFDFSGYSDMAIGLGLMLGIGLPENFRSPYRATSIIEFWRRWHITLSRFLREYLYIPLGGSRQGRARRYRNLMITMLLGGLWHGAAWTFVVWGGLHGVYLAINHFWRWLRSRLPSKPLPPPIGRLAAWTLTFSCVVLAWVPFRAASFEAAWIIYGGMLGAHGFALPPLTAHLFGVPAQWLTTSATTELFGERGFFDLCALVLLLLTAAAAALLFPPLQAIAPGRRRLLLIPAGVLAVQGVLFAGASRNFIYFQF
jgi:alginate O-acetyltransferase complex protein AlgI